MLIIVAWMKEPSAISCLQRHAARLPTTYQGQDAYDVLRDVCVDISGTNMEAELKVLTRQGVARHTGTVAMMQSLRVIAKMVEAEPRPKRSRLCRDLP